MCTCDPVAKDVVMELIKLPNYVPGDKTECKHIEAVKRYLPTFFRQPMRENTQGEVRNLFL